MDMKLSTLLKIMALICFLFGLGYLIIPKQIIAFFGAEADEVAVHAGRFLGGAIFGYGVLAWSARNAEGSAIRRAIKLAIFAACLFAFIPALLAQLSGVFNAFGWIPVALLFLSAVAFGYFRFVSPSKD